MLCSTSSAILLLGLILVPPFFQIKENNFYLSNGSSLSFCFMVQVLAPGTNTNIYWGAGTAHIKIFLLSFYSVFI